jgi:hypothetical protein
MAIVASGQMTLVDMNDSKQLVAYIGSSQQRQVIYNPNNGVYAPNYSTANQILTPQLFVAGNATDVVASAKSIRWFYQTNSAGTLTEITASGSGYTLATSGVKTLTISSNVLQSNTSMTYVVEIVYTDADTGFDVVAKAEIELVKITNGTDGDDAINALTAILSNESHGIPTAWDGNSPVYTNSGTTIRVYEGTTELAYDGVGTANGSWKVDAVGTAITPSTTKTDGGTFVTFGNHSAITADQASIKYTVTGKRGDGTVFTLEKVQTFNKIKQGQAGQTPTVYWMSVSAGAIAKTEAGAFSPTSITATGYKQVGTASPVSDASFKFRIDYDNGSGFVNGTPSASAVASATTSAYNSGLKAVRVRMYLSSVTPSDSNFIDETIIPVIKDGNTGDNAVVGVVWTPDGNTLKNSEGNLKAQMNVYNGTSEVTSGITYKWYIQDPSATASSGGDSDGGTGWRLLNSTYNAGVTNYATKEITIPASAIASVESFMCVATYGGNKYKDVCTVTDVTDPILVTILGMSTFKNGEGTSPLKAILYRNGAEIDSTGSEYTYTWSLYNQANEKITPVHTATMTGKAITVDGRDVNGRANIICEVSK